MDDIVIRFISDLIPRAIAVEKQLVAQGIQFDVTEGEGIRTWYLDDNTHGGDPDIILAKAQEIDPELFAMADVIHEYDPDYFDVKNA